MNKILDLFNEGFVEDFFKEKVLPLYPDFKKIEKIKIIPHKKHVWEHTYHVVIEFETTFLNTNNKKIKLSIFCTAHSNEPRKNVYTSLKYLWDKGFGRGHLSIPHPLFYSKTFQGTFYRGVSGQHLYHYIRLNNRDVIDTMIPKTAAWFAKLHSLKTNDSKNFNRANSRIKTVMPGVKHILERIHHDYPEYLNFYQNIYKDFVKKESSFFKNTNERWLVHGDAHPENIIKMGKQKIAVIDFTDLCLADFSRDLGTFIQQLEYMMNRKINDSVYTKQTIKLFIDSYFSKLKNVELDSSILNRINTYYNWTAIRTTTHFLLKEKSEPERAKQLINTIKDSLNI
jgi:thiamine kinase-like enzyme